MSGSSPTTLSISSLIVAIVGVTLASASLAWQAASFALSGHRVRVELRRGGIRRGPGGTARLAGPLSPSASQVQMMREQGFNDDLVIVEVRNVGRMAVSIESVSINADDDWGFSYLSDPENPSLPHRLEAGSKESWHIALAPLQA